MRRFSCIHTETLSFTMISYVMVSDFRPGSKFSAIVGYQDNILTRFGGPSHVEVSQIRERVTYLDH